MKNLSKIAIVLVLAITTAAFTTTIKKKINITGSTIEWKGKKVLGSHNGTISLKEGYFEMDGDQLLGGMFVIDMTSITVTDLTPGNGKEKLEGHLKSDDFFGIENYPTATLVIQKAMNTNNGYNVDGQITIKGTTQPINFDLNMGNGIATSSLKIDRTKFNVKYGSGSFYDNLGDKTIYDQFELDVTLKF